VIPRETDRWRDLAEQWRREDRVIFSVWGAAIIALIVAWAFLFVWP
jgi:hypothetical protein